MPDLPAGPAVTRAGDLWRLGPHALLCGDAGDGDATARLLGGEAVDMVFTDPPYNVPIDGHVTGLGRTRHREFAFAAVEMSAEAFTAFLAEALAPGRHSLATGPLPSSAWTAAHARDAGGG